MATRLIIVSIIGLILCISLAILYHRYSIQKQIIAQLIAEYERMASIIQRLKDKE